MSNNYEDIIKDEVNKYMEQIKVPKNIGGIIMEDFEKIKNEEAEVKKYNEEAEKGKGSKNKKALKISIVAVSAALLIGTGVFIGSRFLGNSTTINNNGAQNSNMATNNQVFDKKVTIRKNQIENFGKLNQFLRNVHDGKEDEMEIETYLEPEWELVMSTEEPSKLYVKYDGAKYNVKYDIAEGARYSKQTVEGEFSDILIRKITSQSSEYIEMELTFYRINNNKLEFLPVFFFKLSDAGIDPAKSSVEDLLAQDYKTYKKMNDEISNEIYDGLYNLEKDLSDKFGESIYKQKLQQLGQEDESNIINLIKDKETNVEQELVTDAFTYTGKPGYEDISISYKVPKININSDDVTKINSEIDKEITSKAKESIKEISNGTSIGLFKIYYNYYINDNVLSVLIGLEYDADIRNYYTYNIDIKTGKRMSNEDILKIKNMTKKQFEEKIVNAYKNEFLKGYGSIEKWTSTQDSWQSESKAMYEAQYNRTISQSNCNADTQMIYLDANGKINVVAKIYSLAGAESYLKLINIENYKESKQDLTSAEKGELTDFLNKSDNNSFVLMNYTSPYDLVTNYNKIDTEFHKDGILKYSIAQSSYASVANQQQIRQIFNGNDIDTGDVYLISEDNLIKYFEEKLDYKYSKEELKKALKNNFSSNLNMYFFWMSDSAQTKVEIKDAYKISNDYSTDYYLTLNHGQKVILCKNQNSKIFFESCTGYDGTIGK